MVFMSGKTGAAAPNTLVFIDLSSVIPSAEVVH